MLVEFLLNLSHETRKFKGLCDLFRPFRSRLRLFKLEIQQAKKLKSLLFLFSRHIIQINVLARAHSLFILTRENKYHF